MGKPVAGPLTHRAPATTSRELPNGRGFLRSVGGTSSVAAPPPAPMPPPVAPVVQMAAPRLVADASSQLDLLAWVAPPVQPRRAVQLDLFGDDQIG